MTGEPGRRRERSAETEKALTEAARRLFAEYGYLNTKVTDITAAADRAAGSFYNHFASKEDLLRSLLEELAAQADTAAESPAHTPDFTDPAAVRFHVEQYWTFGRRNWPVLRAVQQAALVNDDFAELAGQFAAQQRADLIGHLDRFTAAGPRLPGTPDVSLAMMSLVVSGLLEAVEQGAVELTDQQAIDSLTRFVYRGLTGRDH